jgi:hypothetical protein
MTRISAILLIISALSLSSCQSGRIDVKHPTADQLDALDVQWGLPKRQPKGGAKRLLPSPEAMNLPATVPAALDPLASPAPQP